MSENEGEAAAGSPAAAGAAEGGQNANEQLSKQLMAAFGLVIAVGGGISGVVAAVEPFTKGGLLPVVLTLAALTLAALVIVGGHKMNLRLKKPLTKPRQVMAGIAVAAFALGLAGGYLFRGQGPRHNVPPSTSTSPVASSTECDTPLAITSPTNGTKVVGATGVDIAIGACGLTAGESAWLFDFDGDYGLDGDGGPILTSNQTMTFDDAPIGAPGDVNENTKLVLVLADTDCTKALNAMDLENTQPTSLPQSCQIASQVEIVETW